MSWRVASPSDAWFLLAHYLTSADIKRFEAAAYAVLGSADPRFDMNPDERWMAAVRGIHRDCSGMLRHGIGQVLIMLACGVIGFALCLTPLDGHCRKAALEGRSAAVVVAFPRLSPAGRGIA